MDKEEEPRPGSAQEARRLNRHMSTVLTNNPKSEDTTLWVRTVALIVINCIAAAAFFLLFAGPGIGYGGNY